MSDECCDKPPTEHHIRPRGTYFSKFNDEHHEQQNGEDDYLDFICHTSLRCARAFNDEHHEQQNGEDDY